LRLCPEDSWAASCAGPTPARTCHTCVEALQFVVLEELHQTLRDRCPRSSGLAHDASSNDVDIYVHLGGPLTCKSKRFLDQSAREIGFVDLDRDVVHPHESPTLANARPRDCALPLATSDDDLHAFNSRCEPISFARSPRSTYFSRWGFLASSKVSALAALNSFGTPM